MKTIEEVYDKLGGFNNVLLTYTICLYSTHFPSAWSMIQMTFAGIIPDWYCITEDSNLNNSQNTPNITQSPNYKACEVNGAECKSYHFDSSITSIINEWSLVCDLKWVKATLISLQMCGVLTGAIVGGYVGDRFGRKRPFYSLTLFNACVNIVTTLCNSWTMFAIFRFLCGFGIGSSLVVTQPYTLEFVPLKWRAALPSIPLWVIGSLAFALAAYLLQNWAYLHLVGGLAYLPCLLGWFIVPESIRWLAVQGRVDEAYRIFQGIARGTGRELPADTKHLLEEISQTENETRTTQGTYSYTDLFREWQMAKLTAVFCFNWFSMSVIYYGISFGVSSFSGNFYTNLSAMMVLPMPFYPFISLAMNKIGRRWTAISMNTITCVTALGCLFIEWTGSAESHSTWLNALAMVARVSVDCAWITIITWGPELYPTVTRILGFGAHNVGARFGGMVAPFLINLDDMVVLAYLVVAGLSFLMILACLVPPDTRGVALADSVHGTRHKEIKFKSKPGEGKEQEQDSSIMLRVDDLTHDEGETWLREMSLKSGEESEEEKILHLTKDDDLTDREEEDKSSS